MELLHQETTKKIINAFYEVYNTLGHGFLEKVYENAMMYELELRGFKVEKQKPVNVHYKRKLVGEYFSDIIVNNKIILELKACEELNSDHECQLLNYLKATDIEVGMLFNFGKKPDFKRKIYTNDQKKEIKPINIIEVVI